MGRIRIGDEDKWIKDLDKVHKNLTFTNDRKEAYEREGGFYIKSEVEFVKFHFKDKYPEVANAHADDECW